MLNHTMYFRIISLLLFSLLILFSGCEEASNLVNSNADAGEYSIHGIISDENTKTRLDNVQVFCLDDGSIKSTFSDTMGYYIFNGLKGGEYDLTFSIDGYSTTNRYVNTAVLPYYSPYLNSNDDVLTFDHISRELDVSLYPLIGAASGKVYKVLDDENTQLASGVVVLALCQEYYSAFNPNIYSAFISPDQFTDTTDSLGRYSFNNLPLTPYLVLTALPYNDSTYSFSAQTETVELLPNITITADDIKLPVATQTPFLISNNFENDDFQVNDNITLTFSAIMKTDDFELSLKNGSNEVPDTATWSNNLSLTIDPNSVLETNTTYTLSLNGSSTSNGIFNQTLTFITQDGIELLYTNTERADNIFDNFSTNSDIHLQFNMIPNLALSESNIRLYSGTVISDMEDSNIIPIEYSVSLDTVIIKPKFYNLLPETEYILSYRIYSSIEADYVSDTLFFKTSKDEGINFLWSNLERANNIFDNFNISSDIKILFNMPPLLSSGALVELKDPSNSLVSTSNTVISDTLVINPTYDLEAGQNYTISYTVNSSIAGDNTNGSILFSTTSNSTAVPAQVTSFELADTTIKADYNTTLFNFKWLNVANANGYRIYAKDNNLNSDFVVVGSFSASSHLTYQNQSINLSSNNQFDVYTTDGSQTPLAGGTQLTFGIVAYNDLGESPVSTLITVKDETKPTSTITMSGLANNSSGTTSSTFTLALSANEFLDTDFSYSIAEANGNGGDGSYVIDSTAASYLWNADMKGGVFVFTVPTGKNASSDTFTIIGLKDNSMNVGDTLTFQLCGSGECLVAGCTDPTATNYNSSAVTDDGSCTYANSLTFNFDDGNYPSAFSSTDEWYVTNSSPYDGTFAFRTASGYYQTQNFTLSTSAIPVGSSVTVRFYGKGETSGDGRLIVNNGDVGTFDSHPPNSNSCCWGSAGGYGDTWYQYTYSFTTGPSSTNTFEWKFYTSENGIGYLDKIEIVW